METKAQKLYSINVLVANRYYNYSHNFIYRILQVTTFVCLVKRDCHPSCVQHWSNVMTTRLVQYIMVVRLSKGR